MPGGAARRADNVIDLAAWRATRRPDAVPRDVLAEVDAAGRVYDALLAQGHELRFDLPSGTGENVRALLLAINGDVVRDVALDEVVGIDDPAA